MCGPEGKDWVRIAPDDGLDGPERIEARFGGPAYSPHRHDTYALGLTMDGVQCFTYRGEGRTSLAGNSIVLHPDELHDGHSGVETGFRYRMVYIDPETILDALDEKARSLPFVPGAVMDDPRLAAALVPAIRDLDHGVTPLEWTGIVTGIADALAALDKSQQPARRTPPDTGAVRRAKVAMLDRLEAEIGMDDLETITGQSRFALARHFRNVCGVSPHRWLTYRRLDRARAAMADGESLSAAAAVAGFADQAHMTRHFKSAYGMTPGHWRGVLTTGADGP